MLFILIFFFLPFKLSILILFFILFKCIPPQLHINPPKLLTPAYHRHHSPTVGQKKRSRSGLDFGLLFDLGLVIENGV